MPLHRRTRRKGGSRFKLNITEIPDATPKKLQEQQNKAAPTHQNKLPAPTFNESPQPNPSVFNFNPATNLNSSNDVTQKTNTASNDKQLQENIDNFLAKHTAANPNSRINTVYTQLSQIKNKTKQSEDADEKLVLRAKRYELMLEYASEVSKVLKLSNRNNWLRHVQLREQQMRNKARVAISDSNALRSKKNNDSTLSSEEIQAFNKKFDDIMDNGSANIPLNNSQPVASTKGGKKPRRVTRKMRRLRAKTARKTRTS